MLHTSLSQFVIMVVSITAGTLLFAGLWAGLEKMFPKLKGLLARMD